VIHAHAITQIDSERRGIHVLFGGPPAWIYAPDVATLALSDEDERRTLIVPVVPASRERYRAAGADPQARYQASVTRMLDW
jgi:hypothetical protein